MPSLSRFAHSLALHPARPPRDATALAGVTLEVRGAHTGSGLHLTYVLEGPLERLSIPIPTAAPARADRLWEHTCFELFAGVPGSTRYAEYNFAPTLQWAAYGFRDYRDNDHIAQDKLAAPRLEVRRAAALLELEVHVDTAALQAALGTAPSRFALAAVLETRTREITYWSTQHTDPARADFHRADSFTLALAE